MTENDNDLTAADRRRLSGPALRTFERIAQEWDLPREEQAVLLGPDGADVLAENDQGSEPVLSRKVLERISLIFGIYRCLHTLLPDPEAANTWPRRPNAAALFGGEPALARLLSGDIADLRAVRDYLTAQCQ